MPKFINYMKFVMALLGVALQCRAQVDGEVIRFNENYPAIAKEEEQVKREGCRPLKRQRNLFFVSASTQSQGRVCLVQDLVQQHRPDRIEWRGDLGTPSRYGVVQVSETRKIDVDLRGHLVTGEPFENTSGLALKRSSFNVLVHDGVIRTPGKRGIGAIASDYDGVSYLFFENQDAPAAERIKYDSATRGYHVTQAWNYRPPTRYRLEALTIHSGGRGVALAGDDNALRNSTVEVDSAVAAYFYGPNTVIENNTFIVHEATDKDVPATSAILKLRDAHGAVIRNNRFIFKAGWLATDKPEAAINLLESKDVVIEGNTIEGASTLVRKDTASTTVERGNTLK